MAPPPPPRHAVSGATRVPDPLRQPIDLDLFEGPLDLLLTLVLREEVDLLELPVSGLVDGALGQREEARWDPATAAELVLLLAAVAELKGRIMLGEPGDEEPDQDALDARERLAARLIAYAPFARAAEWLGERAEKGRAHRYRRVPLDDAQAPPPEPGDPDDLHAALQMMVSREAPSLAHMARRKASLPEALRRLRDALGRGPEVSFDEHIGDAGASEEAVALMAALELSRAGEARLDQPRPLGDILIRGTRR